MRDEYINPLCTRYSSRDMKYIFSPDYKFSTWRRLWVALAESERELGIDITQEQIDELKSHITDINYDVAEEREREVRHDVMSHVYAYGVQCPLASPILHLGATSCYVGDNTDILQMRDALLMIRKELLGTMISVRDFADKYKSLPTLAYTHFQSAQPTTVGKRATLWLQDLEIDLDSLDNALAQIKLLGCKGTTGTGASFLSLFDGDSTKVRALESKIADKMGMSDKVMRVSGQTYTRKLDYIALSVLCSIAQSAHKFSNDIRLLSHLKEVDEPFESKQIGSSAMAYKRNPMRSERIGSLARYVIVDCMNPALTASEQWLERTLDDSANRRISIPEAFLAVDGILTLYTNIVSGLKVYPEMIRKHLDEELPFLATENILMYCVKKGGDRQLLHEAIRVHSVAAGLEVKQKGKSNDLLKRILADSTFGITKEELDKICDPIAFTGMAEEQTKDYIAHIDEVLSQDDNQDAIISAKVEV